MNRSKIRSLEPEGQDQLLRWSFIILGLGNLFDRSWLTVAQVIWFILKRSICYVLFSIRLSYLRKSHTSQAAEPKPLGKVPPGGLSQRHICSANCHLYILSSNTPATPLHFPAHYHACRSATPRPATCPTCQMPVPCAGACLPFACPWFCLPFVRCHGSHHWSLSSIYRASAFIHFSLLPASTTAVTYFRVLDNEPSTSSGCGLKCILNNHTTYVEILQLMILPVDIPSWMQPSFLPPS